MDELVTREAVEQAARAVRELAPGFVPELGIILGSGMGELAERVEQCASIGFSNIPCMVAATAEGHRGRLVLGKLAGRTVACMQGRIHAYEGNSAQQVAFPVYLLKALGAQALIVTNAAGGIDPSYQVGDLMLIEDHINLQMINPVIGRSPELGPRFFDMTHAYSPRLRELARAAASECGVQLREGVYIGVLGPSFETPAEIRAFRAMGADAVGMSTVQEVIAANHVGLPVLGISLISNPAAGVCGEPLSIEDVSRAAELAAGNIGRIIMALLPRL
ncbi:MAG: purine-nucleoside phosphorylase [Coriobacteriales bacterium]